MNKNYRYSRSTKSFQTGGSKLTKYQGEISQTGPKNPKLSGKIAGAVAGVLGGLGTAINTASDASRVKRATKAAERGNTKRANRIAGKLSGQAYSDYMMSKKPNPAGPTAEQKRGGSVKRRK